MESMIERVARAQHETAYKPDANRYERWELLSPTERAPWLEAARAAIEAMREPTFEMERACVTETGASPRGYRAMIDAALSPQHEAKV